MATSRGIRGLTWHLMVQLGYRLTHREITALLNVDDNQDRSSIDTALACNVQLALELKKEYPGAIEHKENPKQQQWVEHKENPKKQQWEEWTGGLGPSEGWWGGRGSWGWSRSGQGPSTRSRSRGRAASRARAPAGERGNLDQTGFSC